MRKPTIISLILFILFCQGLSASVNDTLSDNRITHQIGMEARPSYVIPTHGFYRGWNSLNTPVRSGGSAHLKYSFSFPEGHRYGEGYPTSYQGIGLSVNTFLAHDLLGTPGSIYLFQGAPIISFGDKLSIDYEWNFGLSYGWKAYDGTSDEDDMLIGSSANAYINVGILLSYYINRHWKLSAGPEYTHFSNGDTKFPNGGANTINFRVGIARNFNAPTKQKTIVEMFDSWNKSLVWDLIAYGAWRADRIVDDTGLHLINKVFPVAGININPLYRFSQSLSAGASLDLMYDRSANLTGTEADGVYTYTYPGFLRQCAAGLSVRGEIRMPIFAINLGLGYNFLHPGTDLKGLYGIFNLKTFLTDNLFLNIGYRLSSRAYTHNMMFGLGWRIDSRNK